MLNCLIIHLFPEHDSIRFSPRNPHPIDIEPMEMWDDDDLVGFRSLRALGIRYEPLERKSRTQGDLGTSP